MKSFLLVLSLSFLPFFGSGVLAENTAPNVVLIFADDLGYGDPGCYGASRIKTPNIDKLAAEGRRFTDAHSASAVCTPSRYGLLTGEYPFRANLGKGLWGPAPVTSPLLLDTDTVTIADIFKESGYDTAAFGKWHLGFKEGANDWQEPLRPGPQDLGFDYYFGMPVVNSAPPYVYVENDSVVGTDPDDPLVYLGRNSNKNPTPITPIPPEAAQRSANQFSGAVEAHKRFNDFEVGTKLTEKATGWIKAREGKPFFVYFSTTNVHHPFTPAKRFQGTSEAGWYGDFVHELDWIVGEVMKSLEETGVADNTLVLFTSDNGGMFNHGGREAAKLGHKINGDLLGSKFGIWEGGHRVPFIAWWPGRIEAGTVSDQLFCSIDLLASFAALTGQELKDSKDSINMLPALIGDPDKPLRTEMFMTPHKPSHMALRRDKWMFIPAKSDGGFTGSKPGQHAWGGAAVTTLVGTPNSDIKNGKIIDGAPPAQLYDLKADVRQTKNLYYDHSALANEMAEAIKKARIGAAYEPGKTPPAGSTPHPADTTARPIKKYDNFKPVGNLHYSFESGALDGWTITAGKFGEPVTKVSSLARRKDAPFARHGDHHLSTVVPGDDQPLSDAQTGVLKSPSFQLTGDKAAFLVSGGFNDKNLYVALVDANSGELLKQSGGSRDHRMRRVVWDVSKWKGRTVRFEVVDQVTGGWGHLNVDDISAQGELVAAASKENSHAAASAPAPTKANDLRTATDRPNFVIIFADDLGYGDISCYNPKAADTPNIDQLAEQGFRSTDFFIPANVCSPSRAALLTGRYPMRCGLPVARNEAQEKYKNYGFHPDEITIPELLRTAGYRSLMVGKWHLGMEIEGSHPLDAGFDEYLGIASNYEPRRGKNHSTLYRGREVEAEKLAFQELTKRYTDEAVSFIRERKGEPFLLYFSHHIPHTPHLPREEFLGASGKGKYGDVIQELDHSTGRIMGALADAGLDDNTLVVFTSDNGSGSAGSAGPLRGGKYGTMEGGHRVPGIFRWPGQIAAGHVSNVTLSSMDLLPLFCGLAGVDQPADRKIDGADIFPILTGKQTESPHPFLYYYNGTNLQAVRKGDWKLHLPRTPQEQPFWNKKPGRGRVFVSLEENTLFHLGDDIGETQNVAAQHPEIVALLLQQAETIRSELGDVDVKGSDQRSINLVDPQER